MSETVCAFIKPDGNPCAAYALPESGFCLFHDPSHADARAAGRSKGGSTPRRHSRRFPRILDHMHIAELMGELLIDAMNEPVPLDNKRLHSLTHLCQVLLKAVGTPKDSFLAHHPHAEPPVTEEHLLRLYATLAPDLDTVLAMAPPAGSDPDPLALRTPNTQHPTATSEPLPPLTTPGEHTLTVMNAPAYGDAACFLTNETPLVPSEAEQQDAAPTAEQAANKPSTSAPATNTPPEPRPAAGDPLTPAPLGDPATPVHVQSHAVPPLAPILASPSAALLPLCPDAVPEPSASSPVSPATEPVRPYSAFGPVR